MLIEEKIIVKQGLKRPRSHFCGGLGNGREYEHLRSNPENQ